MNLKMKLANGESVFGSFVFSSDPAISEIYADAGFDFVVIDLEHAMNDVTSALQHLRACEARGIAAIIRVGTSTAPDIPRLLDAGFNGIMLPHFGMSDATGGSTRYPPMGERPTCTGIRAARFGLRDFSEYVEEANSDVLAIGLVEDVEVLPSMRERLDQGLVNCVMPGPADLATSMGAHGDFKHPDVIAAINAVFQTANEAGTYIGMYVTSPSEIPGWHKNGARLFVMSIDYKILAVTLAAARRECGRSIVSEPHKGSDG